MLTNTQYTILKADMFSQPSLQTAIQTGDDVAIANFYNQLVVPEFIVWRTSVEQSEYQSALSSTGTLFSWSTPGGYISRSQGERDAWQAMFAAGPIDPSMSNVIVAFNDIFSGTGAGAINNRAHLLSLSKRHAIRIEKLLSTGTGTDLSPATMSYEGELSYDDASRARVFGD